jgi:ATP-dependent DNA helicase RecG
MEHPEFEVIENDEEILIHFRRITPIYPATEGLTQRVLRSLVYRLLDEYEDDDLVGVLPANLTNDSSGEAWRQIHFPSSEQALMRARETLVLAEFFAMQMRLSSRRARFQSGQGRPIEGRGNCSRLFCVPFPLT